MPSDDLLQKYLTSPIDFYALLDLTPSTFTDATLRRAYRKTALKYHPDKVGSAFDPEKYEQFQAANEILGDPESRRKYDEYRNAREQKKRADELFEGKRRRMKEDLEERERGGVQSGNGVLGKRERGEEMDGELRRLAEEGRKRRAMREMEMKSRDTNATAATPSKPAESTSTNKPPPSAENTTPSKPAHNDDDKIAELERKIAEAAAAKEKRKADKKARKSGIYVPPLSSSPAPASAGVASPKFSFTPVKKSGKGDFAETMERLREAERKRMGEGVEK